MKLRLREDLDPQVEFYYHQQFKIYQEPYLIWDRDTWERLLTTCTLYRIEVDGEYGGDVMLENRLKGTTYIIDFSLLPAYQGKGIGKSVLGEVMKMGRRLTAMTRKEVLHFFLKSGFVLKKTIRDYYYPGVEGYYIVFSRTLSDRSV
jgi:RimJ/RimL family protein N-acetyltransferase